MALSASDEAVRTFYEGHPYPPPTDDLDAYRLSWDDARRRAESHLFWPGEAYREDRSILVAGCGTVQAAHYAMRWPRAPVLGIDVSETGIAVTRELKRKYGLQNLELRRLSIERASELDRRFEHVVCTGVLHHLADPDVGLRALRDVLEPGGAISLMLYAPYGRAGIYMLQEYCRRLGIGWSDAEIRDLAATLKALPPGHPLTPLLRTSPDFASASGLADALLHPRDRAYSVPKLMALLDRANLTFGRWVRQAPYLPFCGAPRETPHAALLAHFTAKEQYAAIELFRGTMLRHSFIAYRSDRRMDDSPVSFEGEGWLGYIPIRLPDTLIVRDRLPPGAAAVLINRNHTFTDLYLPVNAQEDRLIGRIDGERSIAEICAGVQTPDADFFRKLWQWDQIVFDTSRIR